MLVAALCLLAAPSLLEREIPQGDLHLYPFKSEDGTLAGEAKATAPPKVTSDHIELKVGESAEAIECALVRGRIEPASRVFHIMEALKKEKITLTEAGLVDVSVVSEAPLLTIDVLYSYGAALGELKVAMLSSSGLSFVCTQDTAGYRSTFRTVVQSLANTVHDPTRDIRPRKYHQIEVVKSDGAPVGVYETVVQEADGGLEERRFRTLIVPSGPGVVRTKEAESRQFERDGSVEDGGYSVGVNDVWSEAQLSRAKDGRYTIKGKHDGKPFENALPAPDGIATENLVQRTSRAVLAKKIESRKFQTFEVEKPDSLLTFTLRRDPSRPSALVMEGAAAPPITLEMDPSSRAKSSSENMGAHRLTTETLFVSGSLP
ncbi:MAG: hypothetical protein E6J62_14065 [Deltaproteobacteria bacterium]|nr:MAG: hypothetical protein E6J62_14065 [Deltaproteobacteria bacterium]